MRYLNPIFENKNMISEIRDILYILKDEGINAEIKKSDTGVFSWDKIETGMSHTYYVIKFDKVFKSRYNQTTNKFNDTIEEFIDRCREICNRYDFGIRHAGFRTSYTMFELFKRDDERKKTPSLKNLEKQRRQFKGLMKMPIIKDEDDIYERKRYKQHNLHNVNKKAPSKVEKTSVDTHESKNLWWKKNSKGLIELAPKFSYDDLMIIFNGNSKLVSAISKTTPKRIALSMFHTLSIDDLNDIVHDNFIT